MSFPVNPIDGQKTTQNNIIYVYSTATNSWRRDYNNVIDQLVLGGGYVSTTTESGSLVVYGGAGITGDLNVGGDIRTTGTIYGNIVGTVEGATTSTENVLGGQAGEVLYQTSPSHTGFTNVGTTGSVLVSYGAAQPQFQNFVQLSSTATSTSSDTGALTVAGGVGVGGDLYVSGSAYFNGVPLSQLISTSTWKIISSDYTAVAGDRLMIDTTTTSVTVTLPLNPSLGDTVAFIDYAFAFGLNTATIARNNELIMDINEDMIIDIPGAANNLVYSGKANGWKLGATF